MFKSLPQYVLDFLTYTETIQNKSYNTVNCYSYDIFEFLNYVNSKVLKSMTDIEKIDIKSLESLTTTDFIKYFVFIKKSKNLSNATIRRKIACIKSLFKYHKHKSRLIEVDNTKDLDYPAIIQKLPITLSIDECIKLLSVIRGRNWERDYAIITLFLNCGLRLSELIGIKLLDVQDEYIRVVGKGNNERKVPINKACKESINNYLHIRVKIKTQSPHLFLTIRKSSMSPDSIQLLLKKYLALAGLDSKYSPHKLRHTSATLMYQYGDTDMLTLKNILGHKNIRTTSIYTHTNSDHIKSAMENHPLNEDKSN